MTNIMLYILLGLVAGSFSGIVGIGGGIIIVPALIFLFGLNQHQAQGTTLALMVLPIGILAALSYYNRGYVDIKIALYIAIGFLFGGLLGAKIAVGLPDSTLQKTFACVLILIGAKMLFSK